METKPLVILVSIEGRGYFEDILKGIASAQHDYPNLRIITIDLHRRPELLRMHVDGFIVQAFREDHLEGWVSFPGPVLNVSRHLFDPGVPTLSSDDIRVGELAAEHFLERGLKEVAVIQSMRSKYAALRIKGFCDRFQQEPGVQIWMSPDVEEDYFPLFEPSPVLDAWIQQLPNPCGIFCTDDFQAKCIVDRLYFLGVEMPTQRAVLGVNNNPVLCELSPVSISSVNLNGRRVGREALKRVMDALLKGKPLQDPLPMIPPDGVVLRKSTDVHCTQDPLVSEALQLISKHLHQMVDIPFLCDHLHVSRRVLERRFKESLGHAPYEHILRARLLRAKQLLLDHPTLPIQEVATNCGYSQPNLFYRQFRRMEACSPSEWRKRKA